MMYEHAGAPPQTQNLYRQGSPIVAAGMSATGGVGQPPPGTSWVQLKTYPPRQPGQPYRGTRFNRTKNKWISVVSCKGREVDIASHDHEEDAALSHDSKILELYGSTACVNFPLSGLVDSATTKVLRLRTAGGQEVPFLLDKAKKRAAGSLPNTNTPMQETYYRPPAAAPLSPSVRAGTGLGGGVLGVNRYAAGGDIVGKQPPLPSRLARASLHGGDPETQNEWMPRSDRAYTAADLASVTNAREHDAGLVYEISFPRPGPLGLNLRSYFAAPPAGLRPGVPPYGCLEVLDAQSVYLQILVEPGDFLISINGTKLTGHKFSFEGAIAACGKALMPRVLRFARISDASAAEIECALEAEPSAVFDATGGPTAQRLVTAQLHPSAPPFFHINAPTRQPKRFRVSPSSEAGAGGSTDAECSPLSKALAPETEAPGTIRPVTTRGEKGGGEEAGGSTIISTEAAVVTSPPSTETAVSSLSRVPAFTAVSSVPVSSSNSPVTHAGSSHVKEASWPRVSPNTAAAMGISAGARTMVPSSSSSSLCDPPPPFVAPLGGVFSTPGTATPAGTLAASATSSAEDTMATSSLKSSSALSGSAVSMATPLSLDGDLRSELSAESSAA